MNGHIRQFLFGLILLFNLASMLSSGRAQTIILSDDFEAGWPGPWTTGNTGSGPTWRDVNALFGGEGTHGGNWKAYCAATTYPFDSTEPNPAYTNKMQAYLETAFSLRGGCENLVLLQFWSKIPSIESCCDAAKVFANGTLVWSNSAPQTAWTAVSVDLSAFLGGMCTLRFEFDSDASITAEGWYLDDVSVMGYDTIPPVTTCPADIVADTDPGQCSKSNVVFTATATDNCPGVTVSCNPPAGSTFPAGITTVTCTASDVAGNTSQCSFTVTVRDEPVITCPSNIVVLACSATAPVSFSVTASNQCSYGTPCLLPDNGGGTANLPPVGCQYAAPHDVMRIIDGLPPGTTVEMPPVLANFTCTGAGGVCSFPTSPGDCADPGGTLGGEKQCSDATLALTLVGTGTLLGFNRVLNLPVSLETHTAPRTPYAPTQSFNTDLFRFFGQITGDPDFDLLRIVAGTDFGLPSPGHATLTARPGGMWAVDSFFDITYRVDFVGRPGGALSGMSGSTTGTIRIWTGTVPPPVVTCTPPSGSSFPLGTNVVACVASNVWGRSANCQFTVTVLPNTALPVLSCPSNIVVQTCSNSFPVEFSLIASNLCGHGPNCALPDNGSGTADLPPVGCQYIAPYDVMYIIDGLPPGTTVKMPPVLGNFTCTGGVGVCSFVTAPGACADPGGSLGGGKTCSDATLALTLIGTGTLAGFNRAINLPVGLEIHMAPRTPGAPVQSFDTDMFRFFGQITGDPDFDLLRITAGTDFGMPSPGHTTLTRQPDGTWSVDSFFDITYRVDFVGRPGGALAGMSGSTTATIRWRTGAGLYPTVQCTPSSGSQFPLGVTPVTCVATNQWGTNTCSFSVTVTATRPTLNVSRLGTNVLLHWPEACATYQLQSTPHLTPPIPWSNVPTPPMHVGVEWQVSVSPPPGNQFFRLKLLP